MHERRGGGGVGVGRKEAEKHQGLGKVNEAGEEGTNMGDALLFHVSLQAGAPSCPPVPYEPQLRPLTHPVCQQHFWFGVHV